MDYIVSDPVLVPPAERAHITENLLVMPHAYPRIYPCARTRLRSGRRTAPPGIGPGRSRHSRPRLIQSEDAMNPAKLPLVAQPARTPPLDIAQVSAQGFALHQQGRLAEAAEHYRAVLRQAPRHFDALHLAGVAAHGLGDDLSAEQQIRKALKLNP